MGKKKSMLRVNADKDKNIHIDMEKEIIKGFIVCSLGVTHDARGEFDSTELDKLVMLGNKSKIGMKSRFGHPMMSSTALGTFLGRVRNFKRDGDHVRGDLYLDQSAHNTPDGDLSQYVMDLAQSDPDAFGASMVIDWDPEFRKKKYRNEETKELKEVDDYSKPPFIRVNHMFAVDIVDDPAATNGMFGKKFFNESVSLSAEVQETLDKFLQQPEAVSEVMNFLRRYQSNSQHEQFKDMDEELEEIIELYANKRRGKKLKESFDDLNMKFQDCLSRIKSMPQYNQDKYKKKSFAAELFDKFNLSNKIFGNFHYFKQWWKPRFIEGKQIDEYIISVDNGFSIHMEKDIFMSSADVAPGNSVSMFIKESSQDMASVISESIEYVPAQVPYLNETTMPSWIKPLSSGKICIQESSPLEKTLEVILNGEPYNLKCNRENENSDFWKISKLA